MSEFDRITAGLKHLAAEFSCEDWEFERDFPSNNMLLGGLVSLGYAKRDRINKRYAITEAGRQRLKAAETEAA